MKTYIEVGIGANQGFNTPDIDDDDRVFAFEPAPHLYNAIRRLYKKRYNSVILPIAISDVNGIGVFNVCKLMDHGLGSLYEFHPGLRDTFYGSFPDINNRNLQKRPVLTLRLDTFIDIIGDITEIEFLWIDAQGSDLRALKSLGDKIGLVKHGRLECSYKTLLYTGSEGNKYEDAVEFLESHGFEVEQTNVHEAETEIDLHFHRKT